MQRTLNAMRRKTASARDAHEWRLCRGFITASQSSKQVLSSRYWIRLIIWFWLREATGRVLRFLSGLYWHWRVVVSSGSSVLSRKLLQSFVRFCTHKSLRRLIGKAEEQKKKVWQVLMKLKNFLRALNWGLFFWASEWRRSSREITIVPRVGCEAKWVRLCVCA